jgi:hypothetical protein
MAGEEQCSPRDDSVLRALPGLQPGRGGPSPGEWSEKGKVSDGEARLAGSTGFDERGKGTQDRRSDKSKILMAEEHSHLWSPLAWLQRDCKGRLDRSRKAWKSAGCSVDQGQPPKVMSRGPLIPCKVFLSTYFRPGAGRHGTEQSCPVEPVV